MFQVATLSAKVDKLKRKVAASATKANGKVQKKKRKAEAEDGALKKRTKAA